MVGTRRGHFFTAIPRTPETNIGKIHNIRVENVTGVAENSVRINGTKESRISNVHFENVHVTLNRWTDYPGNLFDNRPPKGTTTSSHMTIPVLHPLQRSGHAKQLQRQLGRQHSDYFSNAIKAHDVTGLKIEGFQGNAAHPERDQAIVVPENDAFLY